MSIKVLSPVGDFDSLHAAINNGADEVYLGISGFNARNNIEGFNLENIKLAIDKAHLYSVRVFLAINILFSNSELQNALNTIIDAYNLGVDAFIIQDLGLAHLLHTNYPEIELHASTQMGIHNLEGAKFAASLGFKRIVLARETSLEEIKNIKNNLDIEIEYFAQGALCVSFSGNCYLSSYLFDASGNRGKCKQLCRLPYTLSYNGKDLKSGYLLSAKDFNMIDRIKDLQDAGVDCLKIEGRARRASYVAIATKTYRNAIDKIAYNKTDLDLAFSRNFTEGYFNGNNNIISQYKNHIGLKIGKIIKVNKGKKFNEIIFTSSSPLSNKSTFKIISNHEELASFTAYSIKQINKTTYSTTTTQTLPQKGDIHLIVDYNLENKAVANKIKRKIDIKIKAVENQAITASCVINNSTFSFSGPICQPAQNQPLTNEDFIFNFNKTEVFEPSIKTEIKNIFLTKQQLNQFRKEFYINLEKQILSSTRQKLKKIKIEIPNTILPLKDFAIVDDYSTLPNNSLIIYSPEFYTKDDLTHFIEKCKNLNKSYALDLPNFTTTKDLIYLKNLIQETNIPIVANNYGQLNITENYISGAGLNIYNNISANFLGKPFLTAEKDLGSHTYAPYMTLRHCPMKEHLNCTCANCKYKNGFVYTLENKTKLKLKRKKLTSCTFYLVKD